VRARLGVSEHEGLSPLTFITLQPMKISLTSVGWVQLTKVTFLTSALPLADIIYFG
jgi:hypothetical protein